MSELGEGTVARAVMGIGGVGAAVLPLIGKVLYGRGKMIFFTAGAGLFSLVLIVGAS